MKKKMLMKTLGVALLAIASAQAMAWSVVNSKRSGSGINHYVSCDSGSIIVVLENPQINKFFIGGVMYGNMYEAVSKNCN